MSIGRLHCVILAAGNSSRLGRAKQLLRWRNEKLLVSAIRACSSLKNNSRIASLHCTVVLGAFADEIQQQIQSEVSDLDVQFINNKNWQEGMGSTIRCAMQNLREDSCDVVLFSTCDQVLVGQFEFELLLQKAIEQPTALAVAAAYSGTCGIPALFRSELFTALRECEQKSGAKKILIALGERCALVQMTQASIDIDTPADWEALVGGLGRQN